MKSGIVKIQPLTYPLIKEKNLYQKPLECIWFYNPLPKNSGIIDIDLPIFTDSNIEKTIYVVLYYCEVNFYTG